MNNLQKFYEIKVLTLEDIENNINLDFNNLDEYLNNYEKLYKVYDLLDTDSANNCKKKILENIEILIESNKNLIKNKLKNNKENLIEVSNEYYNFITYLFALKDRYPLFKEVIIIDDIV